MLQAQLERGYRLVELLKQPLNSPVPVEEQVVSIFAGTSGYLDDLPTEQVVPFEAALLEFMRTRRPDVLHTIRTTGALPEGDARADAVSDFTAEFASIASDAAATTAAAG